MIKIHNLKVQRKMYSLEWPSCEIFSGEKIGLIGANGAGKSTLLDMLSGFIKYEGSIFLNDFSPQKDPKKIYPFLGYVFQNPSDQLFSSTIDEDIRFAQINYALPEEKAEKIYDSLISTLHLEMFLKRPPYELSFGEKKRAAIASALAHDPEIIFFDEPFAGLDRRETKSLKSFISTFSNKTIILTGHHFENLYELCPRFIVLSRGRVVFDGSREELSRREADFISWGLD